MNLAITFITLILALHACDARADGRDRQATSTCSAQETEKAVSILKAGSGWSDARWAAAQKLLECHGGKFKHQELLRKNDGTDSSYVTYRIGALNADLSYEYKANVWLNVDEHGITNSTSGQKSAR